jgi:putative DNA primase/helicase
MKALPLPIARDRFEAWKKEGQGPDWMLRQNFSLQQISANVMKILALYPGHDATLRSLKLEPGSRYKVIPVEGEKFGPPRPTAKRPPPTRPPVAVTASSPAAQVAEPPPPSLLVSAAAIQPERIGWLWHGWLAQGKIHVLAGAPGTGKTTLAISFAAVVSAGAAWPDGTIASVGDVLIWSGEDGIADTLIPRLAAAGADLHRVHIVGADERRPFHPGEDLAELEVEIRAREGSVRLVILDPLIAVVGLADSHKNSETRAALAPLAELARRTGVAILGVHHLSKGTAGRDPTERLSGSVAFGAVARVVMITAQGEGGGRVLMRSKSNLGRDDGGFEYEVEERELPNAAIAATVIRWGAQIEGRARDVLAATETQNVDAGAASALSVAKRWLEDLLSDGPVAVREVESAALAAGMAWATIRRAKDAAGVEARKGAMDQGWTWALPSG